MLCENKLRMMLGYVNSLHDVVVVIDNEWAREISLICKLVVEKIGDDKLPCMDRVLFVCEQNVKIGILIEAWDAAVPGDVPRRVVDMHSAVYDLCWLPVLSDRKDFNRRE